mgnify:CR=1 FL=1
MTIKVGSIVSRLPEDDDGDLGLVVDVQSYAGNKSGKFARVHWENSIIQLHDANALITARVTPSIAARREWDQWHLRAC